MHQILCFISESFHYDSFVWPFFPTACLVRAVLFFPTCSIIPAPCIRSVSHTSHDSSICMPTATTRVCSGRATSLLHPYDSFQSMYVCNIMQCIHLFMPILLSSWSSSKQRKSINDRLSLTVGVDPCVFECP